jgi:methylenetetrahydromethanopterin dehydrogenase
LPDVVKIGILKIGCIGTAPLIEYLLDERAEREDIEVRVVGTGAKMNPEQSSEAVERLIECRPDFALVISPNASLPGPKGAREALAKAGIPTVVVSDSPARRITKDLESAGFGYIVLEADAMIGARREFLDPNEVAFYNGDTLKVLAVTGALACVVGALDSLIEMAKKGEKLSLPNLYVDQEKALAASGLSNPYARAKAMAAHDIARRVAAVTAEGCFVVKEWERYTPMVASAHEMMRVAARLADEAREIEKGGDMVLRRPHARSGAVLSKTRLMEKPVAPKS